MLGLFEYVPLFGLAALACAASVGRAREIEDVETRYGMVALLVTSGGWAAANASVLLLPRVLAEAAYVIGLTVGLSTVGAWLYFCSAYTGRSLHRRPMIRRSAAGVFLLVTLLKLTNPLHEQYFTTMVVTDPFTHLVVQFQPVHYVVAGLSYVFAAVGFFMLFEEFIESGYDARGLVAVTALAGLPVTLDLVADAGVGLIDINYEPLGVAAFALGILFVYEERFLAVQLTSDVGEPVVFLDEEDRIRDFNEAAVGLLPGLDGGVGAPASTVAPLEEVLSSDDSVLAVDDGGERRYYLAATSEFEAGQGAIGRMVLLTDVTTAERRRREIQRHNEQLEDFAAGIRHELHNALQVVIGRIDVAGRAMEAGDLNDARESIQVAADSAAHMRRVVDDLSVVARHGKSDPDADAVPVEPAVKDVWTQQDTAGMALAVNGSGAVVAEPARFDELLSSVFDFARHTDTERVVLAVTDDGFTVTYEGVTPVEDEQALFDYGEAVPHAEAGMALPKVRTLTRVHGWECGVGGREALTVRITGADVRGHDPASPVEAVGA